MRRLLTVLGLAALVVLVPAGAAFACDGHYPPAYMGSILGQSGAGLAALGTVLLSGAARLLRG